MGFLEERKGAAPPYLCLGVSEDCCCFLKCGLWISGDSSYLYGTPVFWLLLIPFFKVSYDLIDHCI